MVRFQGKSFKGARKTLRELKRQEADRRNAATPDERRSTKTQQGRAS